MNEAQFIKMDYASINKKLPSIQGIYMIKCIASGRIYIGQSVNIKGRAQEHRRALEKGIHNNRIMQNNFNKYGQKKFIIKVVEEIKDTKKLTNRENYWANYYNSFDKNKGFNICPIKSSVISNSSFSQKFIGSLNGGSKLTEKDVIFICDLLNQDSLTYVEIAKKFGVTYKAISHIKNGRNWRHISEKYLNEKIKGEWRKTA